MLEDPSAWAEVDEHFEEIFRWELPPGHRTPEEARQLRRFYLDHDSLSDDGARLKFVQLCTDIFIAAGSVQTARLMAESNATVYMYQFTRDGPLGIGKQSLNATYIPGVMHGDDMVYVYDFTEDPAVDADVLPIPASERPIRERQAKLFANMAKTGNPTPEGSGLLRWPQFAPQRENYMDMDVELSVRDHALGNRITLWRRLFASRESTTSSRASSTPGRKG